MRVYLLPLSILAAVLLSACTPVGLPDLSGDSEGRAKKASRSSIIAATRKIETERRLNLPQVAIGDTYVFDNPITSWEVVDISSDNRVTWVSNQGARIVTSNNPLLPSYEWISENDGQGKRLISDVQGSLFPLRKSNKVNFRSTVSITGQPTQWSFHWNCSILDEANITVPAGNFNTFRIACARDTSDTITYYFSPELGYYVRMETGGTRGSVLKQRNLLSYNNVAGASLQATQNLRISDDDDTDLFDKETAPTLPLPIDGIAPNSGANQVARDLLKQNRPQNNRGTESVLPVPGLLETLGPSGNLAETTAATTPQLLIPAPAASNQSVAVAPAVGNILAGQTVVIHLASYRNRADAERGWNILLSDYSSELNGRKPAIRQVDLGAIGVFFRLYASPFNSLQNADNLCKRLKTKGLYCQVSEI